MKFTLLIDSENEPEVIVRVRQRSELTDQIEALVMQYSGTDSLPAYTEDAVQMLPFRDMECITVLDGKTYAVDTTGKLLRLKLKLYEVEQLVPASFIRINKSSLANENRLARFRSDICGGVTAVFRSGYTEYVSRRCFAEIKRRFDRK